jgi:hypothetical protein
VTTIDRAKLEEAIRRARAPSMTAFNTTHVAGGGDVGMMKPVVWLEVDQAAALALAAEAHLATLPKTAKVSFWRVEFARMGSAGKWIPDCTNGSHASPFTREEAEREAASLAGEDTLEEYRCIRVTGPHEQEIPA